MLSPSTEVVDGIEHRWSNAPVTILERRTSKDSGAGSGLTAPPPPASPPSTPSPSKATLAASPAAPLTTETDDGYPSQDEPDEHDENERPPSAVSPPASAKSLVEEQAHILERVETLGRHEPHSPAGSDSLQPSSSAVSSAAPPLVVTSPTVSPAASPAAASSTAAPPTAYSTASSSPAQPSPSALPSPSEPAHPAASQQEPSSAPHSAAPSPAASPSPPASDAASVEKGASITAAKANLAGFFESKLMGNFAPMHKVSAAKGPRAIGRVVAAPMVVPRSAPLVTSQLGDTPRRQIVTPVEVDKASPRRQFARPVSPGRGGMFGEFVGAPLMRAPGSLPAGEERPEPLWEVGRHGARASSPVPVKAAGGLFGGFDCIFRKPPEEKGESVWEVGAPPSSPLPMLKSSGGLFGGVDLAEKERLEREEREEVMKARGVEGAPPKERSFARHPSPPPTTASGGLFGGLDCTHRPEPAEKPPPRTFPNAGASPPQHGGLFPALVPPAHNRRDHTSS